MVERGRGVKFGRMRLLPPLEFFSYATPYRHSVSVYRSIAEGDPALLLLLNHTNTELRQTAPAEPRRLGKKGALFRLNLSRPISFSRADSIAGLMVGLTVGLIIVGLIDSRADRAVVWRPSSRVVNPPPLIDFRKGNILI